MGWTTQGYFSGFNYDKQVYQDPCWHVNTNGEIDEEIDAYDGRKLNRDGWELKLKVFYGTTGGEFFKGYIETGNIETIKDVLKNFNGFLVYEYKYGGQKVFDSENLLFYTIDNFTVFIEKRLFTKEELAVLNEDLKNWILPEHLELYLKEKLISGLISYCQEFIIG